MAGGVLVRREWGLDRTEYHCYYTGKGGQQRPTRSRDQIAIWTPFFETNTLLGKTKQL